MANYNLDISGVLAANRISNEQAVIVPGSPDIHKQLPYIIPQFGPFYGPNFVIRRNSAVLTEGVDYQFAAQHLHAKQFLGKNFYGAIVFLDRSAVGTVQYDYNTLGGDYVVTDHQLLANYYNTLLQQRVVNWDMVYGVPALLPPIQAQQNLADLAAMDDVVTAINALTAAIIAGDSANVVAQINNVASALTAHTNVSNPHGTTKTDIGLGNVLNYNSLATLANIFATGASKRYLTTGNSQEWDIIRNAFLQLAQTPHQDAVTTNSIIFQANSLGNITLPNGTTPAGSLYVVQLRLSDNGTTPVSQSPRIQIGLLVNEGVSNSATPAQNHLLIRRLPANATGTWQWTVIPNWTSINNALTTITNSIQTQVNAAIANRIKYGEHEPTVADFSAIGDIYFKF